MIRHAALTNELRAFGILRPAGAIAPARRMPAMMKRLHASGMAPIPLILADLYDDRHAIVDSSGSLSYRTSGTAPRYSPRRCRRGSSMAESAHSNRLLALPEADLERLSALPLRIIGTGAR